MYALKFVYYPQVASGYEKFILVLEFNCIRNPTPNHSLKLTTLRTSVSEWLQLHFKNMMLLW